MFDEAPTFVKYDEEQIELISDTEDWQDGREGGFLKELFGDLDYTEDDYSLTGNLSNLRHPMGELLSRPLTRSKAATDYHDQGNPQATSGGTYGLSVSGFSTSTADNTPPESETVLEAHPWEEQMGLAKQKLTEMTSLALYSNTGGRFSDLIRTTEKEEKMTETFLEKQLINWHNGMELKEKKKYNDAFMARIQSWNRDIEGMLESAISTRRILEDFLEEKEAS